MQLLDWRRSRIAAHCCLAIHGIRNDEIAFGLSGAGSRFGVSIVFGNWVFKPQDFRCSQKVPRCADFLNSVLELMSALQCCDRGGEPRRFSPENAVNITCVNALAFVGGIGLAAAMHSLNIRPDGDKMAGSKNAAGSLRACISRAYRRSAASLLSIARTVNPPLKGRVKQTQCSLRQTDANDVVPAETTSSVRRYERWGNSVRIRIRTVS